MTTPHRSDSNTWKTQINLDSLLEPLAQSEAFKAFSQGHYGPQWEPPPPNIMYDEVDARAHIDTLGIPAAFGEVDPPMLLHRLGNLDSSIKDRVDDIFAGRHTFLLNCSGSGKTRLLFEGLCTHWGLYFTTLWGTEPLGSSDILAILIRRLAHLPNFTEFPLVLENVHDQHQAFSSNLRILRRHASCILLQRLLVFQLFLDKARAANGITPEHKKLWLITQLHVDALVRRRDIFSEISRALVERDVDDDIIDTAIAEIAVQIAEVLGKEQPIFLVLDGASMVVWNYEESFRDCSGQPYPLLKALLRVWRQHLKDLPFRFIVAGTRIARDVFADEEEWGNFVWSSNTGSFDDCEVQRNYIHQFLSPRLRSSVGESLHLEVWKLLRGRYHYTAGYAAVLVKSVLAHPTTSFELYVRQLTGRTPTRGFHCVLPPLQYTIQFTRAIDMLVLSLDQTLRSHAHLAILDALLFSEHNPGYPGTEADLISHSVGRFSDSRCQKIVIDEPIIIVCAVHWFLSKVDYTQSLLHSHYFSHNIIHPTILPRHPSAYLAFYLARAFSTSRPVSKLFTLFDPLVGWANVIPQPAFYGDSTMVTPRRRIVTYSVSTADTLVWMRHPDPTPFCIHLMEDTSTLIFLVELSNNTCFWAFVRAIHSLSEGDDISAKIRLTVSELQAEAVFRDRNTPGVTWDILTALDSTPNPCAEGVGAHGVLPVVAVFGSGNGLSGGAVNCDGNPESNFALLNFDELTRSMDSIDSEVVGEWVFDAAAKGSDVWSLEEGSVTLNY